MRYLLWVIVVILYLPSLALAQSFVVYEDDFEAAVSGWSVNSTEFDPDVTTFLGRFDNSPQSTSRSFTLPASTESVVIAFDFYRFDSWDNNATWGFDRFQVDIDGTQIFSLPFSATQAARSGSFGTIDWSHTPLGPTQELAFGTGQWWFDQLHRVTITVNDPGATLDLTLRTNLNQGGNDESGGFDNINITAFVTMPELDVTKTVNTVDMLGDDSYALPGAHAEYEFVLLNTGGAVDDGSIVITDKIPDNLTLFTGDLDGFGNPVMLTDLSTPSSGLSCCTAGEVTFSDSTVAPLDFTYVPSTPYDEDVTHIRITPSGALRDATVDPLDVRMTFQTVIE